MNTKLSSAFIKSCHHVVSEIPQLLPFSTERNMVASSDLFSDGFIASVLAQLARDGVADKRPFCTPCPCPADAKHWAAFAILYPMLWPLYQTTAPLLALGAQRPDLSPGPPQAANNSAWKNMYSQMADVKNTSARHRFTTRQHPLSPCHGKLPVLPRGKRADMELLSPVPAPRWLDLSLPAAWKYGVVWKENSRDIPLSKGKVECKLSPQMIRELIVRLMV